MVSSGTPLMATCRRSEWTITAEGGDQLEFLGEDAALVHLFQIVFRFTLDGFDLASEFLLLVGEHGRADPVGVVEVEQLLTFSAEAERRPRRAAAAAQRIAIDSNGRNDGIYRSSDDENQAVLDCLRVSEAPDRSEADEHEGLAIFDRAAPWNH